MGGLRRYLLQKRAGEGRRFFHYLRLLPVRRGLDKVLLLRRGPDGGHFLPSHRFLSSRATTSRTNVFEVASRATRLAACSQGNGSAIVCRRLSVASCHHKKC